MVSLTIKDIIASTRDKTLVAATKYANVDDMLILLENGINNFGENIVDSFLEKYQALKTHEEIIWHFIGNLQTNKVSKMINKINYLHSLNSLKLAKYIDKYRLEPLKCYLEVNITRNKNKTGVYEEDVFSFLEQASIYKNVNIIGLMGMTDRNMNDNEKSLAFKNLRILRDKLVLNGYKNIKELSMGMSDDYLLALKEGATSVRLGRILFETEGN